MRPVFLELPPSVREEGVGVDFRVDFAPEGDEIPDRFNLPFYPMNGYLDTRSESNFKNLSEHINFLLLI